MNPSLWVVIPSAGKGRRFGSALPKQYQKIFNKSVLEHTLMRFLSRQDVCGVVLAVSLDDFFAENITIPDRTIVVAGGDDRSSSVYNALLYLKDHIGSKDLVAVHDAARPCIRQSSLDELFAQASQHEVGAVLALSTTDTVKLVDHNHISQTLDREHIFLAQTPQVFRYDLLLRAIEYAKSHQLHVTDESSAVELLGLQPLIVWGKKDNIKITTADDLNLAAFFLDNIQKEND